MPPKQKVTKEMILEAANACVGEHGIDALNARSLATKLGCSTQPIFSNYPSMMDLRKEIIAHANEVYQQYLQNGMKDPAYPPYKASGFAYIRFAMEQKELFKLLFMRNRSQEQIDDERKAMQPLIQLIADTTGFSLDNAYMFHVEMWLYVHGIATTLVCDYLQWNWDIINHLMNDAYEGMILRYQKKEKAA